MDAEGGMGCCTGGDGGGGGESSTRGGETDMESRVSISLDGLFNRLNRTKLVAVYLFTGVGVRVGASRVKGAY
jgi:hypothetical protein